MGEQIKEEGYVTEELHRCEPGDQGGYRYYHNGPCGRAPEFAALIREDSMPEVEIVRILGVIHPELDSL